MAGRVRGLLERLLVRQRAEQHNGVPDAELLRRFSRDRDESAFELLVWRHGAMVLGLCRRAVRDEQLAEDAFQAVFLVLARKAGGVRGNLGGWLFKVARRVSLRAAACQPITLPAVETATEHPDAAERNELSELLDAEIARLPERLRRPVVLCYLGGQSTEDAARELGCPRGTVLSRLAAARKRLADRLTRRGCTLPATLTATALSGRLVSNASAAAAAFRSGLLPASAATFLANGVLQTMSRITFLTAFGGIALAASLVGGVGWMTADRGPNVAFAAADTPTDPPKPAPEPPKAATTPPKADSDVEAIMRRAREEQRKKLEQLSESLRVEIETFEKQIDLLMKAGGGQDAAELQKRLSEDETELRTTNRELLKLEAEAAVLKKVTEDKNPPAPDPAVIEEAVSRDARVLRATQGLAAHRQSLEAALKAGTAEDAVEIKTTREAIAAFEKDLADARKRAATDVAATLRAAEVARLRQRLFQIELEIKVKQAISDKLKAARDATKKLHVVAAATNDDVQRMRDALKPQYEALARVQNALAQHRIGITVNAEASGTDAKLDAILKELAALRKEVQELKAKK